MYDFNEIQDENLWVISNNNNYEYDKAEIKLCMSFSMSELDLVV